MTHGEDFTRSHAYATSALQALRDNDLPATPSNYQLWYTHLSGQVPALSKALDAIIAAGRPITADDCDRLCAQYLRLGTGNIETVFDTGLRVEDALGQIMQLLDEAGIDQARFGDTLSEASGTLERVQKDPPALRRLLDMLAQETRATLAQNMRLQSELKSSSHEIRSLRTHLEEVRREAMTDSLTGIGNRKLFDLQLQQAITRTLDEGVALSLVMMDIDHFKQFNDRHGHQLGDQVLRLVARCLTDCVKGRDIAARYGGEEFVVILPATPLQSAVVVAEQIRKTVVSKRIVRRRTDEDLGGITLSLGVAELQPGESGQALVQRADEALYAAKRLGRNRTASEIDAQQPAGLASAG